MLNFSSGTRNQIALIRNVSLTVIDCSINYLDICVRYLPTLLTVQLVYRAQDMLTNCQLANPIFAQRLSLTWRVIAVTDYNNQTGASLQQQSDGSFDGGLALWKVMIGWVLLAVVLYFMRPAAKSKGVNPSNGSSGDYRRDQDPAPVMWPGSSYRIVFKKWVQWLNDGEVHSAISIQKLFLQQCCLKIRRKRFWLKIC